MRFGRYTVTVEAVAAMRRLRQDARRIRRDGVPAIDGATVEAKARAVLRANAKPLMLRAGAGHFHAMWVADMGVAFVGALRELPREYLRSLLERIIATGAPRGEIPTCFDENGAYDLPWERADTLPWLLWAVEKLDDRAFVTRHHDALAALYAGWVGRTIDPATALVRETMTGDWVDTVPRPSSTYNNVCAIYAHLAVGRLGIDTPHGLEDEAARALIAQRWTGTHLRDHTKAGPYLSADANVLPAYLGVLPAWLQKRAITTLEESALVKPVPMRAREGRHAVRDLPLLSRLVPSYHSTIWLHLGLVHTNALRQLGMPYRHHVTEFEVTVLRHGNLLETLDGDGEPHITTFLATEYGFTMSAGQYLEAIAP
ncbi:MAG: hypothetical protein ACYDDF_09030 [Thermoplasmatota archaeon]